MKRIILIVGAALLLAGCVTLPEDPYTRVEVVTETKYVIRKASDQQKALPAYPANIDVTTATQSELAEWIAQSERRQYDLESIIRRLIQFYEQAVTPEEKAQAAPAPAKAASAP